MYDHLGLHVKDLKASIRFYEATLGALGHVLCSQDTTGAGLGPKVGQDSREMLCQPLVDAVGQPRDPIARALALAGHQLVGGKIDIFDP